MAEYSANFTSPDNGKALVCERENCRTKTFPPGTEMHHLHNNEPGQPGRKVCSECYQYYLQKTTTKRRGTYSSESTLKHIC